ncbi:MAG TPA: S1/P1 nuclease [Polyangia bacterium]|nr:S1/P1 nuclease [Polyangia bacterium]
MTRRAEAVTLVAAMVLVGAPGARAWDDLGHMEVAAVAFPQLTPASHKRVAALLRRNPSYANWIAGARKVDRDRIAFLRAATWADAIKSDHAYKDDEQGDSTAAQNLGYGDLLRHRYWHYVDRPFSPDGTPLVEAKAPNAATQIARFRAVLAAAGGDDGVKSYDLTWLLHLVGDVHQPLHCVSRFDRQTPGGDDGGNKVKITGNTAPAICDDPRYCPFGPPGELHTFYDVLTGQSYAVGAADAAAAALPPARPSQSRVADEAAWIQEGWELAQSRIYVAPIGIGAGPFTIDADYQRAATALARQRISLAGARLARLLNDCFQKEAAAAPPPSTGRRPSPEGLRRRRLGT